MWLNQSSSDFIRRRVPSYYFFLSVFFPSPPQMSGIRDLIPGSVIDATMFNPCGYSMNGMKTDVGTSVMAWARLGMNATLGALSVS